MSKTIDVVSGVPRSGTSLVMQMLAAGGHPVLVDAARPADAHNPRGYFEYERAKAWNPPRKDRGVAIRPNEVLLFALQGDRRCRAGRLLWLHLAERVVQQLLAEKDRWRTSGALETASRVCTG